MSLSIWNMILYGPGIAQLSTSWSQRTKDLQLRGWFDRAGEPSLGHVEHFVNKNLGSTAATPSNKWMAVTVVVVYFRFLAHRFASVDDVFLVLGWGRIFKH